MKLFTRFCKWIITTISTLLLIPVLIVVLLYIPPVQNWVVQKVVGIVSEKTDFDITLERVGISFPLDIELRNLTATQFGDTLLRTREVVVDLDFNNIFQGQIGVDGIDIVDGKFDSQDLIPLLKIKGSLDGFHIYREDTDLKKGIAHLSNASLDGCLLSICMADTMIVDTSETEVIPWQILVDAIEINNSSISFNTAGDTLSVLTEIKSAKLQGGNINLAESKYQIDDISVELDTTGVSMKDLSGETSTIPLPYTTIVAEKLSMDSCSMGVEHLDIALGEKNDVSSHINGKVRMDFDALTPNGKGELFANIKTSIGNSDILNIAHDFIPKDIAGVYPSRPINAHLSVRGNIDTIVVDTLHLQMPTVVDVQGNGYVAHALKTDSIEAEMDWDISTMNLNFVRKYLQLTDIEIPRMDLNANTKINGNRYKADAVLRRGEGSIRLGAVADLENMAYSARVHARDINIKDFLPKDSMGLVTASARIRGRGSDFMSKATRFRGEVDLKHFEYNEMDFDNARLTAMLRRGKASVELHCDNDILMTNACVEADLDKENSNVDFTLSLNRIDLYALGIAKDSVVASMILNIDGGSDMKQNHRLTGSMHSIELATPDTTYYPLDLNIEVKTNETDILARTNAGNLWLQFHANESLDSLTHKLGSMAEELTLQQENRVLDYNKIRSMFPKIDMHILCGNNNPLANIMRSLSGATLNEMAFDLIVNPDEGINGQGYVHKLRTSAVVLDTFSCKITQLPDGIDLMTRAKNGPRNKVVNFESTLNALITARGIKTSLEFIDGKGKKGIDLGVDLETKDSTLQIHLTPHNPILAYRSFSVNPDNVISIDKYNHIKGNTLLNADDGTSVRIYSTPNENAEQDITVSVNNFNLGELSSVMPFMPMITGMINGDVHAVKEGDQATLSVDMNIEQMGYEGSPVGDIGLAMIYFPNADGSHLVDGILSQNNREIILLGGKYWNENEEGQIEANADFLRLPLNIANGLVTDNLARLEGYITGVVDVRGAVSMPKISGALSTDSVHICSDPYSIDLRLPDDTVVIRENFVDLDKIQAYANNNNPLTLDGVIDFTDFSQAKLDLGIIARDFNLINAPKRKGAEAYGKVYVDIYGRMKGSLNNLDIRGRLNVNGKTNVTYVLKDSPLMVDDQLSSLVSFTDFEDTLELPPLQMPEQNIKMDFQLNIDEATTIHCLLSEDGQDKIDIEGGGELRMTYDMISGPKLFGRYTVLSGRMDYSLIVVSLKNFQIESGSFVEFSGDILNPKLDISASERKKASVTANNTTRSVNFDVGLKISQTLSDLGLEFTLKAPDDITVQNELSSMSVEERGRTAVAMLTTGMYLSPNGSGGTGNFDATNALNSFLNSQISNIAGKALSTIDVGFGIDNTTSATGAAQTDYNFSFAKRFWGNRISVIIGGKVSSGNDAQNTGMSIIDNVSIEYRLDNSGTRYVKAFYNKDSESILDSEVMEMGASLVLRRKTEKLKDLFIFRDTKKRTTSTNNLQGGPQKK